MEEFTDIKAVNGELIRVLLDGQVHTLDNGVSGHRIEREAWQHANNLKLNYPDSIVTVRFPDYEVEMPAKQGHYFYAQQDGVSGSMASTESGDVCAARVNQAVYTLRVDPVNGSDAYTRAQVLSNPDVYAWASVYRAMTGLPASSWVAGASNAGEAAQAGDIVLIEPGAYQINRNGNTVNTQYSYYSANQGTVGNPIIYKCRYPAAFLDRYDSQDALRSKLEHTNGSGSLLVCIGDYVYYDGFYMDARSAITGAEEMIELAKNTRGGLVNCDVRGSTDPAVFDSGHFELMASGSDPVVGTERLICNNRFRDFANTENGGFAVIIYSQQDLYTLHNEVYDIQSGIFFKGESLLIPRGSHVGGVCAFNKCRGISRDSIGFQAMQYQQAPDTYLVYQNDIINEFRLVGPGVAGYLWGISFINNTINCTNHVVDPIYSIATDGWYAQNEPGFQDGGFYNRLQNNLITNISDYAAGSDLNGVAYRFAGRNLTDFLATPGLVMDRNVFANIQGGEIADIGGVLYSLSAFQSATASVGHEANSQYYSSSTGIYTDEANDDLTLAVASAAKTANGAPGQDYLQRLGGLATAGIDVGAYITGVNEVPGLLPDYDYSWHYNGQPLPRDNAP